VTQQGIIEQTAEDDERLRSLLASLSATPVRTIATCIERVRQGDDPDAVHDLRVATRRLRALLSVVESFAPDRDVRRLTNTVKGMGDALGEARDVDVMIEYLHSQLNEESYATYEKVGVQAMADHFSVMRVKLQDEIINAAKLASLDLLDKEAHAVFGDDAISLPKDEAI